MLNIAVIDDEEFYHNIWKISLGNECNLFIYNDPDQFIDTHLNNLNMFEYIIADIMYGNRNILNINFSKIIRKNKFNKEIILYSNYKQDFIDLENTHYYDLLLEKDRGYTLSEIKNRLAKNRIHWRARFRNLGIEPII
jgi:hypothetical protein